MAEEKGKILKLLKLDKLFETLMKYIETQIELIKLDIKEQAEKSIQNIIQVLFIILAGSVFLVFFSICIAIGLNELFKSNILGYLCVSLVYLVILLIVVLDKNKTLGKWIYVKFINSKEE